ncbi:hypothetical protein JCM10207_008200 [Rhodosporidiobolus poonsookiae]
MNPPTTPPRRLPHRGGHLHKRTASKVVLTVTPSTPPNANRMLGGAAAATYRLIPESPGSPGRSNTAYRRPPADGEPRRTQAGGAKGATWSRRRTVLAFVVGAVLLLVATRHRDRWSSLSGAGGDSEPDTYGRGHLVIEANLEGGAVDAHGRPRYGHDAPHWHHAPVEADETALAPGAGRPPAQAQNDRFVKVPGRPAGEEELDEEQAPAAVNLEVTSATDPDAAQKYLLVGWMGEQETKAQGHLYQLGLLALATNRTLVLPGVKRSRFGTCYHNPFSLYYAADSLASFGFPYITSEDFWAWTERQRTTPSAQVVTITRGDPVPIESVTMSPQHMCLAPRNLDFSAHDPQAFFVRGQDERSSDGRDKMTREIVASTLDLSASVLVMHVNLRWSLFNPSLIQSLSPFDFPAPAPYSYFPYSPHWTALGHAISSSLSPFVAAHWRTETIDVARLQPCGEALIAAIRRVREENPDVETLYLATDYPLEILRDGADGNLKKATAHSGTMTKTLTPAHHAAMRAFLDALEGDRGTGLRLTSFVDEQKRVEWPEELRQAMGDTDSLEDVDGAIVGIVDKIVLMEAEYFYAGLPVSTSALKGCGKLSQFTTQVIAGRKDALRLADDEGVESRLQNDVTHFKLDGQARGLR